MSNEEVYEGYRMYYYCWFSTASPLSPDQPLWVCSQQGLTWVDLICLQKSISLDQVRIIPLSSNGTHRLPQPHRII